MKKIILDSSFIISAIKKKIDIFEELLEYKIIIPEQVIQEIERITKSKQSLKNRQIAELALKLLENNKFEKLDLGKGHTDNLIVKYAKESPRVIVATLDKEIKSQLKGRLIIIRGKKIEKF